MDTNIKNSLLSFLIIIVVAGTVFAALSLFNQNQEQNKEQATKFRGLTQRVEGNSVTVKGNYDIADKPEYLESDKTREVTINLNSQVKYVRVLRSLPSPEELEKLGTYKYDQFPMERQEVSIEQFMADLNRNEGLALTVSSENNIFAKISFTPSEVEYTISTFAQPLSP